MTFSPFADLRGRSGTDLMEASVQLPDLLLASLVNHPAHRRQASQPTADGHFRVDDPLWVVTTLAQIMEVKDPATSRHLRRTFHYAVAAASQIDPALGSDPGVQAGFLLHDIGKVVVPTEVILKPGPLSEEEWETMRRHPTAGAELLAPFPSLRSSIDVISYHHERFDGNGYPHRVAGEDIPLAARIFQLADAFDAMTSDRSYRSAMPVEQAVDELQRHAGTQFDPEVTRVFSALVEDNGWPMPDRYHGP